MRGGQPVMQRQPRDAVRRRRRQQPRQRGDQRLLVADLLELGQVRGRETDHGIRHHPGARGQRVIAAVAHETQHGHVRHMAVQHDSGAGIGIGQLVIIQPLAAPQPVRDHAPPARPPDLRLEPRLDGAEHQPPVHPGRVAADEEQRDLGRAGRSPRGMKMRRLGRLRQIVGRHAMRAQPFGKIPRGRQQRLIAAQHSDRRDIGRADHPQDIGDARHRLFQMRARDLQQHGIALRGVGPLAAKQQVGVAAGMLPNRPHQPLGILRIAPAGRVAAGRIGPDMTKIAAPNKTSPMAPKGGRPQNHQVSSFCVQPFRPKVNRGFLAAARARRRRVPGRRLRRTGTYT